MEDEAGGEKKIVLVIVHSVGEGRWGVVSLEAHRKSLGHGLVEAATDAASKADLSVRCAGDSPSCMAATSHRFGEKSRRPATRRLQGQSVSRTGDAADERHGITRARAVCGKVGISLNDGCEVGTKIPRSGDSRAIEIEAAALAGLRVATHVLVGERKIGHFSFDESSGSDSKDSLARSGKRNAEQQHSDHCDGPHLLILLNSWRLQGQHFPETASASDRLCHSHFSHFLRRTDRGGQIRKRHGFLRSSG